MLRVCVVVVLLLLVSCRLVTPSPAVPELVQEFVFTNLSFTPVAASAAGYHIHNGIPLDEKIDSFDEPDLNQQRRYLHDLRKRLNSVSPEKLSAEDRADYDILLDAVNGILIELDTIQSYKYNPTVYVELIGNALFNPYVLEYAPKEKRYEHITARLQKVPALLGQARQNLQGAPEIWAQVAARENDGNHDLIVNVLTPDCPYPNKATFDRAARQALRAVDEFTNWLTSELVQKKQDWRLGREKYAAKFGPALGLGLKPEQVLADAETELQRVRRRMVEIARPLHETWFPGGKRTDPDAMVRETLARIGERHAKREEYFKDAARDLDEVRQFVSKTGIVKLPPRDNLKVIETPAFMRGIYSVGGFNPAPALEPKLGAFYWLTPIPETMDAERIASKLREYNYYGLKILTIHEAIPGHYLQAEFANGVLPNSRRILRAVYGNTPYVEGWAVYATDVMVEQGYLDKDPQLQLTWLKQYLRAVANTILDVRLQTMGMTEEQAMDLMLNQTFQEKEEATAKLQRAKLSSAQLPTYFAGYRAWKRLRERYASMPLAVFHEKALRPGAVPMPALERILVP